MDAQNNLTFRFVQAAIEMMADELWKELLTLVVVEPDDFAEARDYVMSRRAEVVLAGMRAFDRLRRMNGDDAAFAWRPYVRKMMSAKLLELFERPDDGDGAGAKPSYPGGGPRLPGGGIAQAAEAGGATGPSMGWRSDGMTRYISTRDDLARAAYNSARSQTLRIVGSWSADSGEIDDLQQTAGAKAVDRCERRWDPERSPLSAYLNLCVNSVIREEYRTLCKRKSRGEKTLAESKHSRKEDVRLAEHSDESDPTKAYLRACFGEDDPYQLQRLQLRAALEQLTDRQREEVMRRMINDTPGTNADQNAYSRAIRKLQRVLGLPFGGDDDADEMPQAGELSG
jgi:DNA-directed RNA polymerase specialized sigma24 family protein